MVDFNSSQLNDPVLKSVVEALQKQYKEVDELITCVDPDKIAGEPSIKTGSIALDKALGIGGVPKGRTTLICGEPATAKSTLCMSIVKQSQIANPEKTNIYVDMEAGAFTDQYAYNMGLDIDPNKLLIVKPTYAEQAFVAIQNLISTGKVGVCVWDSLGGALTKEEMGDTAEDNASRAGLARLLSTELKRLSPLLGKTGTTMLVVSQIRTQMSQHVTWKDISGGWAQKFFASVRIDLAKKEKPKDFTGKVDRETIVARITKNKVGSPYKEAEFEIKFGEGIIVESGILYLANQEGIVSITNNGWVSFPDLETGEEIAKLRSKELAVEYLVENPDYAEALENRILGYHRETEYEQTGLDAVEFDYEETVIKDEEDSIPEDVLNA